MDAVEVVFTVSARSCGRRGRWITVLPPLTSPLTVRGAAGDAQADGGVGKDQRGRSQRAGEQEAAEQGGARVGGRSTAVVAARSGAERRRRLWP
jgi:hypothetical protein